VNRNLRQDCVLLLQDSSIPKSVVKRDIERTSVEKWQSVWNRTTKGNTTKQYFPIVAERLNIKISTDQYLTTMLTGHGNIKSYLYRFKLITSPTCPCGKNDQTHRSPALRM
jgi:hypothetical protein